MYTSILSNKTLKVSNQQTLCTINCGLVCRPETILLLVTNIDLGGGEAKTVCVIINIQDRTIYGYPLEKGINCPHSRLTDLFLYSDK